MANVTIGSKTFTGVSTVVMNTIDGGTAVYGKANWDQNSPDGAGYISGRPLWVENRSVTWDGNATDTFFTADDGVVTAYLISELMPSGDDLVGGTVRFIVDDVECEWPIIAYCKTTSEIETVIASTTETQAAIAVNLDPGCLSITTIEGRDLAYILATESGVGNTVAGIYAAKMEETDDSGNTTAWYLTGLDYTAIVVDERYEKIFKTNNNIYVVNSDTSDVSALDFTQYTAGDIILVAMPS